MKRENDKMLYKKDAHIIILRRTFYIAWNAKDIFLFWWREINNVLKYVYK